MSVLRSPTGTKPGGSQPDLSKLNYTQSDLQNISLRKRKQPEDDITSQFSEFREQMAGLFKDFMKMQDEKLSKISEEVSSINNSLKNLQCTTENLISEQCKIINDVADLKKTQQNTEDKLKLLEDKIDNNIQGPSNSKAMSSLSCEEIVLELKERNKREKNIIITGVSELQSTNLTDRSSFDTNEVSKITDMIVTNCAKPIKTIRLGKYNPDKIRPIKAFFNTSDIVKTILRKKSNVTIDGIKIYSDQTPYQQKIMQDLKEELKTRTNEGEDNLSIKYINGVPKILQVQNPKN